VGPPGPPGVDFDYCAAFTGPMLIFIAFYDARFSSRCQLIRRFLISDCERHGFHFDAASFGEY